MVYNVLHFIVTLFYRIVFRFKSIGRKNIPENGAIIASNHISLWDPTLIGCGLPASRKVNMMAKEELFHIPVISWFVVKLKSFPVRRGMSDRNAIRLALGILAKGEIVGIFPEGTRSKTGVLGPAHPGMALIALKAGVPIVPTAIIGTNNVFRNGHFLPQFKVRYGKPVYPLPDKTDKENSEYMTQKVMQEISLMLDEER